MTRINDPNITVTESNHTLKDQFTQKRHDESTNMEKAPHIYSVQLCVTFYSEGFSDRECFAVGVYGDLVVQQGFVHDEGVQPLRVSPANTQQQ